MIHSTEYANLRRQLLLYLKDGGTYKDLSLRCAGDPSATAIGKIAGAETKNPRPETVARLLKALRS